MDPDHSNISQSRFLLIICNEEREFDYIIATTFFNANDSLVVLSYHHYLLVIFSFSSVQ